MSKVKPLFDLCAIAFGPINEASETMIKEMQEVVQRNGAELVERNDKGSIPVHECTHIVADKIDFAEYEEAMAMMVPVVRPLWVQASLTRNRLAQIRPYSPDPRLIFSEVVMTCDDIPLTDKESIAGAVLALGGTESKDLGRLTTHVCALSVDGPKVQMAFRKHMKCKVVLPHWFDDCFRLGKKIDETPYLLPDPEILSAGPDDPIELPSSEHLQGATSALPDRPLQHQSVSRQKPDVFKGKKVALSLDLNLNNQLRNTLKRLVLDGGGMVVDTAQECDWFVCQYRDGPEYIKAAQQGKDVGSLAWLYHIIFHNHWSDPLRRLLHYPVPREGMEGFKELKISISNYGGEARMYLQNLLKAAGVEWTGTMKQDNTHLITARKTGDKCEAAQDWNLPVVNHLWIEESYAKCELQALTNPRYTHFPPRTNLGEVIGQTHFDEAKLHEKYYPGGDDDLDAVARRKRRVRDLAYENAQMHGPAAGLVIGRQRHPQFDIMKDDETEYAEKTAAAFGVPAPPKLKAKALTAATPVRARHIGAGKENDTPSAYSSGGRSAKAVALSKLHSLAPDIELYEKERKRKSSGNTPFGGKRATNLIEQEREREREKNAKEKGRFSSPTDEETDNEEELRPAKRQKPALPPIDMRIILTGYRRWVDSLKKEDADKRKLRSMGIVIVSENAQCDYLAAPQLLRTVKFLRTLAKGPKTIDSKFIDDCLDTGERPDVDEYPLKDKEREKRFDVNLEESIARARKNQGRLLRGVQVYCTSQITSGPDSYRPIAEANGAIFKTYSGRTTTIKPTNPDEDSQSPEPVYLLTSNSPNEKALWPRFEKMARDGNMEPRIVSSDWLLQLAMSQKASFENKYLAVNFFKNKT